MKKTQLRMSVAAILLASVMAAAAPANARVNAAVWEQSRPAPAKAEAATTNDVSLSGLEIQPGALASVFVSATMSYTAEVPSDTQLMVVTGTPSDENAQVTYASSAGVCGVQLCLVAEPTTWITVTVTSADQQATREYFIEARLMERPNGMSDASLFALKIEPGELSPAFVSSMLKYTASVDVATAAAGTPSVMMTALPNNIGAQVAYASSAGSCDRLMCAIARSTTWITMTVTSANDRATQEYVVEITLASPMEWLYWLPHASVLR
jgi:hypothetical protein